MHGCWEEARRVSLSRKPHWALASVSRRPSAPRAVQARCAAPPQNDKHGSPHASPIEIAESRSGRSIYAPAGQSRKPAVQHTASLIGGRSRVGRLLQTGRRESSVQSCRPAFRRIAPAWPQTDECEVPARIGTFEIASIAQSNRLWGKQTSRRSASKSVKANPRTITPRQHRAANKNLPQTRA